MRWPVLWKEEPVTRLRRVIGRRPWERPSPCGASAAIGLKGMLGAQESLLFYHLARDFFTGRGAVVDAGSFLGKSASLFAAGLTANRSVADDVKKVHCFDNFLVNEAGTVAFIKKQYGRDVAVGDSTRDLFDNQVAPVRHMLDVHSGDFLEASWSGDPIEILMVDIAKSQRLWARVLAEMFPRLIPGVSLVVHQDYHHQFLPYIHIVMEFLHPFFELVIPKIDGSAVFLLQKAVPAPMLERAIRYDFAADERCVLMDAAIERMPTQSRFRLRCARAEMLHRDNHDSERLLEEIDRLKEECIVNGVHDRFDIRDALEGLSLLRRRCLKDAAWRALRVGDWSRVAGIANELRASQEDDDTLLMRGCSLIGLGRFQEAEDVLRLAPVSATPGSPFIPMELARAVSCQGRHDEAQRMLVTSLEALGDGENDRRVIARHVEVLQEICAARGDVDKDREAVETLRRLLPGDPWLARFHDNRPL